jgi:uncharacterized protein YjbI with pentapeptide repeats
MNRIVRIIIIVLICLMFVQVFPVTGQEKQDGRRWTGKYKDGTVITEEVLIRIVKEHKRWIETHEKDGKQADLSRANLSGANLFKADLSGANLSGADLSGANLSRANLSRARLSEAKLFRADLSGADMIGADLSGADMIGADLSGAYLIEANLSEANLHGANLSGAYLLRADLSGAYLFRADLSEADLSEANLIEANLSEANLDGAMLIETKLKDCIFYDVKGLPIVYEPKAGCPPYIPSIAEFPDLKKLTFVRSPHGLVDLREGFKKLGYRKQEREITYALKYTQRRKLWNDKESSVLDKFESLFYFLFFELTCQYGMKPGRPLLILMGLIPFFSFFYLFALGTKRQKAGIWLVFPKGRVPKTTEERPFKLSAKFPPRALPNGKLRKTKLRMLRWFRVIRIALYFSMLSAFSIGWRELNVGNWITRLQRREYFLRSTGWVRTVSGIQSLSSVYLLALWVLTYFGRPFEAI